MFDIGWSEMAVIVVITILVIGPKELPVVLRTLGRWAGKARRAVRDLQAGIDDVMREADLSGLRNEIRETAESLDLKSQIREGLDPSGTKDGAFDRDDGPTSGSATPSSGGRGEGE